MKFQLVSDSSCDLGREEMERTRKLLEQMKRDI